MLTTGWGTDPGWAMSPLSRFSPSGPGAGRESLSQLPSPLAGLQKRVCYTTVSLADSYSADCDTPGAIATPACVSANRSDPDPDSHHPTSTSTTQFSRSHRSSHNLTVASHPSFPSLVGFDPDNGSEGFEGRGYPSG